jgi:hypothetical protein
MSRSTAAQVFGLVFALLDIGFVLRHPNWPGW